MIVDCNGEYTSKHGTSYQEEHTTPGNSGVRVDDSLHPEHIYALRQSVVVAAENHRHIHGARMPIPVRDTVFTRVLALVLR